MKNTYTRILFLVLAVMLAFSLTACGGEDKMFSSEGNFDTDLKDEILENEGTAGTKPELSNQSAKIIRTVTVYGETKAFDNTTDTIKAQIKAHGGYIESSELYGGTSYYDGYGEGRVASRTASYVIRIPSDNLDAFLASTEGTLNVTSSSESTKDVTLDYYDIQSRLDTLKSKKAALENMLEQAQDLDELLKIQETLYDVIADIESYQSKLNLYDNMVSYSTLNLTVKEVVEYTITEPSFGQRVAKAFKGGWSWAGNACKELAIAFIYAMPVIIVAVIAFIVVRLIRKKKADNDTKH